MKKEYQSPFADVQKFDLKDNLMTITSGEPEEIIEEEEEVEEEE